MKDGHDGRIKVRHQDLDSLVRLAAHCLTNISDHQYDDEGDDDGFDDDGGGGASADDQDFDSLLCLAAHCNASSTYI